MMCPLKKNEVEWRSVSDTERRLYTKHGQVIQGVVIKTLFGWLGCVENDLDGHYLTDYAAMQWVEGALDLTDG